MTKLNLKNKVQELEKRHLFILETLYKYANIFESESMKNLKINIEVESHTNCICYNFNVIPFQKKHVYENNLNTTSETIVDTLFYIQQDTFINGDLEELLFYGTLLPEEFALHPNDLEDITNIIEDYITNETVCSRIHGLIYSSIALQKNKLHPTN